MKFGKGKHYSNNALVIPIGKNGIGEEPYKGYGKLIKPKIIDPIEEKILSIVFNEVEEDNILKIPSKWKLYLNTTTNFINLLVNRKKKFKNPNKKTIQSKVVNWWRKDTTNDLSDLVKFIIIHGLLGAPALVAILTLTNLNISLIQYIRENIWLTTLIYIIGTGAGYYLFLDVNTALKDTWRKRGKQ